MTTTAFYTSAPAKNHRPCDFAVTTSWRDVLSSCIARNIGDPMAQYPESSNRILCALLVFCILTASADAQNAGFKIVVQEGQGAINNIQQHRAKEPVVLVLDDEKPVPGVSVTFLLPDTGASGAFNDGAHMLTVQTDEKGQATGHGLRPNQTAGTFQIRVTASNHGQTASAVISQVNAAPAAAGGGGKKYLIIALIGGAAAAGLGAALGGKKGSSSVASPITTPPTVLVPGTPSIQPPH
jgi:hypothetical protein